MAGQSAPSSSVLFAVAERAPFAGLTIVVTRSREQASALSERLRALGATVIEIPTIAIAPPATYAPLDRALAELGTYDWLIVTSANTARVLGERSRLLGSALAAGPRVAAVGKATAAALEGIGLPVDLVPQPAVAESIVAALRDQVAGRRVLLARAAIARDVLPVALAQAGAQVTVVDAYRTVLAEESAALVRATFGSQQGKRLDALTFTSSSTVRNLSTLLDEAGLPWPAGVKVFSIGPVTTSTLRERGIEPAREAERHDVEGLIEVLVEALAGELSDSAGSC